MIENMSIMSEMLPSQRERIWDKSKTYTYQMGDELLTRNGKKNQEGLFLIERGIVQLCNSDHEKLDTLPSATFVGIYNYFCPEKPPIARYMAKTVVDGRHIPLNVLSEICESSLNIKEVFPRNAGLEVIRAHKKMLPFFRDELLLTLTDIDEMVMEARVVFAGNDEQLGVGEGNYLLLVKGAAVCYQMDLHLSSNAGFAEKDFDKLALAKSPVLLKS